jgi:DMSO/TMAO reductase YedYZ molybdopterin-dependent catalytic subunit
MTYVIDLPAKEVRRMNRRLLIIASISIIVLAGIALTVRLDNPFAPASTGNSSNSPWTLKVDGLVQHPLNLTLNKIVAMPKTTEYAALYCVDNPQTPVTTGNWTGVRLSTILETAGVSEGAIKVAFHAKDGYSTDLNITTAMRQDIILAYQKNGKPLTETLRLVVPGKWGYKWISMVTHIQLVNYDFKGTWENNGYSDNGDI